MQNLSFSSSFYSNGGSQSGVLGFGLQVSVANLSVVCQFVYENGQLSGVLCGECPAVNASNVSSTSTFSSLSGQTNGFFGTFGGNLYNITLAGSAAFQSSQQNGALIGAVQNVTAI